MIMLYTIAVNISLMSNSGICTHPYFYFFGTDYIISFISCITVLLLLFENETFKMK